MLCDFRVFLGRGFDGVSQTADMLLGRMDSLGIQMAVACPLKPLSYDMEAANAEMVKVIRPHSDRLVGAARVDPWQPAACDMLLRGLESQGLRALYLDPWQESFRIHMDRLDPLMQMAQGHGVPVLVAAGYPWVSESLQVAGLAKRWPQVPIVMSNGGQLNISGLGQSDATLALRQASNLYIDTAGVYRQDFIERTITEFGPERVLFASGAPIFDQRYEIRRAEEVNADIPARRALLGGNALRLLAWSPLRMS